MSQPFLNELRGSIASDDAIEEVLRRLTDFLRGADQSLYNEALQQSGRLRALQVQLRKGVIQIQQYSVERAAIRAAILDFIDEIERASSLLRYPFSQPAVEPRWPPGATQEKIIGANRLKSIAWVHRAFQVARSVCRIRTSGGLGTGFMIDGGWLVTNHHVLPTAASAEGARAEFNFEEDANGNLCDPTVYPLDASSWKANELFDCAAIQTAPPSAGAPQIHTWGVLQWSLPARLPAPGDYVTIVQHPSGGPKMIALSENQVVNIFEHRLQYTTDTEPGSSGSPVFDDDWRVVAVHHAGGNLVTNPRGDRRFINEGILASHVRSALSL